MIFALLFFLLVCLVVYFGIEPYSNYKKQKIHRIRTETKIKEEKARLDETERIRIEVEEFARQQREKREREKRLADIGVTIHHTSYVRGGHGNQKLMSWSYSREDIDD